MTTLEDRYRRLLAFYPREHRLMYGEEMIAVLMAGAEPGQRRPSLAECADLAMAAVAVRLRRALGAAPDPAWRRAAYTALLAGAFALLAISVHRVILDLVVYARYQVEFPADSLAPALGDWLRPALWGLVIAAALIRLRRTTALLAVAALAAEVIRVAAWYAGSPSYVLQAAWLLTGAAVVTVIAAWLIRGEALARSTGWVLLPMAGVLLVGSGVLESLQPLPADGVSFSMFMIFGRAYIVRPSLLILVLPVVLVAWAWWRQPAAERLRVLVFGVPVLAMTVLVPVGYGGFMYSSQRAGADHPNYLVWFQWVILVAVPLLAFAVAVLAVNRYERIRRLVLLGRAAEQREVAPGR
jgi:hypothetical protein